MSLINKTEYTLGSTEFASLSDIVTQDPLQTVSDIMSFTDFMSSTEDYMSSTEYLMNSTKNDLINATAIQKTTLNLYQVLVPSLGVFVIILNFLVVFSSGLILKKGQQPATTYLFLGNVALCDLVTGIAVVIGAVTPNESRDFTICVFQLGLIVSSTLASVYSVGLIAVDRFLYILHGLQYQRWMYPFRARICILISWIIGVVIGFMPITGWAGDTNDGKICWFIRLAPKNLILLTILVGVIPLITVIVLYAIILYNAIKKIITLQKSAKAQAENRVETTDNGLRMMKGGTKVHISDSENEDAKEEKSLFKKIFTKRPNNKVKSPSKWKAVKVVMFTSGSFLICWGPYFIISLIYSYCDDKTSERCKNLSFLIASPLAILGFLNSLINPIIYAWWHQGFRTFITKKFSILRKKQNSVTPSKNTSSTNTRKSSKSSSLDNVHLHSVNRPKSHSVDNINLNPGIDIEKAEIVKKLDSLGATSDNQEKCNCTVVKADVLNPPDFVKDVKNIPERTEQEKMIDEETKLKEKQSILQNGEISVSDEQSLLKNGQEQLTCETLNDERVLELGQKQINEDSDGIKFANESQTK